MIFYPRKVYYIPDIFALLMFNFIERNLYVAKKNVSEYCTLANDWKTLALLLLEDRAAEDRLW